mmetsp:Transcript_24828/g.74699  ORF Transcript_24828/g.74699 Transcript_24828/m.74699 type:complete len:261 (-) Transcript_24828:1791-2573(-)
MVYCIVLVGKDYERFGAVPRLPTPTRAPWPHGPRFVHTSGRGCLSGGGAESNVSNKVRSSLRTSSLTGLYSEGTAPVFSAFSSFDSPPQVACGDACGGCCFLLSVPPATDTRRAVCGGPGLRGTRGGGWWLPVPVSDGMAVSWSSPLGWVYCTAATVTPGSPRVYSRRSWLPLGLGSSTVGGDTTPLTTCAAKPVTSSSVSMALMRLFCVCCTARGEYDFLALNRFDDRRALERFGDCLNDTIDWVEGARGEPDEARLGE